MYVQEDMFAFASPSGMVETPRLEGEGSLAIEEDPWASLFYLFDFFVLKPESREVRPGN